MAKHYEVIVLPGAQQDIEAAFEWLHERSPWLDGLNRDLIAWAVS
jgi:hypothetical protein